MGKCFQIYEKPSDRLKQALWGHRLGRQYYREFWAVRDISFTVARGEGVGFVGRNGAGKSTLLQMIAGTMSPSLGEIDVRGRVAALLELGSGFNPEFTGRENVFLNGLILGVSRREMQERFEQIVSFSEIGEFIDQPVKTYSSGMRARLAFSVSTAVEPDILILDEVLSVGDAGFKQKCVARMKRMRGEGLTLLFVSHSPGAVKAVCDRAIFLDRGRVIHSGSAESTINEYLRFIRESDNSERLAGHGLAAERLAPTVEVPGVLRYGCGHVQLEQVRVLNRRGEPCSHFDLGEEIIVEAAFRAHRDVVHLSASMLIRDRYGVDLTGTTTADEGAALPDLRRGQSCTVRFRFENALAHGEYGVCMAITRRDPARPKEVILYDQVDRCAVFEVMHDESRPVHYRFFQPMTIEVEEASREPRQVEAAARV